MTTRILIAYLLLLLLAAGVALGVWWMIHNSAHNVRRRERHARRVRERERMEAAAAGEKPAEPEA